jgi:putative nucleotidyltransferase with HDIG domain
MPRTATGFIVSTALAAVLLAAALWPPHMPNLPIRDAIGLAAFIGIAVFAEAMAIDFRPGSGRRAKSSLAFLPFISSILLFEPITAVLLTGCVIAASQFGLRRNDFPRAIFNVSQAILSAGLGALAYSLGASDAASGHIHFGGFLLLAVTFFATNLSLSTIALALISEAPLRQTATSVIGYRGANLWFDLLASPIAIVPAALYGEYHVAGLLVIVLPLLLIRYSYLSKVKLEEANKDLLKVLIKAIETRDPYTSGHSMRVATLARAIAEDLRLSVRQVQRIETAALLHDIGKIDAIYELVIRKPYDLTTSERELIRTHATKGADLLESLASVEHEVVNAVRHHHERFDGTGYPSGMKAEAIPVAARIIMLCDSIDAMLSDRPYRKALTIEETRKELVRCSGTQFDPEIVAMILQQATLERAVGLVERPIDLRPAADRLQVSA